LVCNECLEVVRTLAAADVPMVLGQMMLSQTENTHAHCPHCGALNTFPRFSSMLAFSVVLGNCVMTRIVADHVFSEIGSERQNSSKLAGDERQHWDVHVPWRYRSG
jgi:hypothetical protein